MSCADQIRNAGVTLREGALGPSLDKEVKSGAVIMIAKLDSRGRKISKRYAPRDWFPERLLERMGL